MVGNDPVAQKKTDESGLVLIMDDEEMIRDLLAELLKSMGYQVEQAQNGREVIELYKKANETGTPHDLVIMDLTVPGGMGGKEAIAELLLINPDIKAIVSSGYSNDPIMADCRKYGFCGVLKKPFKIADLKNILLTIKKSNTTAKSL
jgi:CheY-like chemotaxis protein